MNRITHSDCPTSFLVGIAAIVSLSAVLCFLRLVSNISFSAPLHLITSGSEEQSFLSLWRVIHHQPVYSDPHKIPFTFSYLNWLFYAFYGILIKGVLVSTKISEAWIPTIGRLISFSFSTAGFFITGRTLRELFPNPPAKVKWLFHFVSFYLFFGPLPAFWPLTTRPDMAAVIFELLAFYFFVKELQNRPTRAALMATFFAFVAWSFKQSNVTVILSLIIYCLIYHRRNALLMGSILGVLCSSVLWLGGPAYRASTLFSFSAPGFSAALGLKNFVYYLAECVFAIPGYVAMGSVFFSKTLKDKVRSDKIFHLLFIIASVTSLIGGIASQKVGASENYFIPASIFVTFFCVLYFLNFNQHAMPGLFNGSFYFSLAMNSLLIFVILLGIKGKVSKRYEHKEAMELLQCTQSLPRPIFSQTAYLNLPWMLGGESFIPGYTYWVEKNREEVYERRGIEGLIQEGYFASLLLERAKISEIFGDSAQHQEWLKDYLQQKSSSCPSTHVIFIKKGILSVSN